MVKTIIYALATNFVPSSLAEVESYARENDKVRVCYANEDQKLFDLEKGAHITTSKGNQLYVLDTKDDMVKTGEKECGITGIAKIDYPFGAKTRSGKSSLSIKNFADRIKNFFTPVEAEDVRIAMDGSICVATKEGYVSITDDGQLVSYPTEMTFDFLPALIISKPASQLVVGDVIARDRSYAKVTKIDGNKITAIGYTGTGATIHTIKDIMIGQAMVRVVVSMAGNVTGLGTNPAMMMALAASKNGNDSMSAMLPFMFMNQQGGTMSMNPMMMAMLAGGDKTDFKDIAVMSMLSGGQNPFAGMFGAQPVAQAAAPTVAAPVVTAPVANPAAATAQTAEE